MFRVWDTPDSRATRDIDFLAYVDNSPEIIANIVRDICGIVDPDDGLFFDAESVVAQRIKEDADYEGVRVRFRGQLGNARIHMQVDVGFGDLSLFSSTWRHARRSSDPGGGLLSGLVTSYLRPSKRTSCWNLQTGPVP